MSFLLLQMLICLLIAGLIGAVIGWLLRGNCSKKLQEHDEECQMKMRAVEREWNTKLNYSDDEQSHIDNSLLDVDDVAHADLKNQVQNEIDATKHSTLFDTVATALGIPGYKDEMSNVDDTKQIQLSDEKIKLYTDHGIDLETSKDIADNYDIQVIEGINSKYAKRLNELEIFTTHDLLKKLDRNYADIDNVAKKLKVQSEDILSWISMADILRLPKLNTKNAQLIQTVGISSVRDLSVVNTYSLHKEMMELNEKLNIAEEVPDIGTLEVWSKIAKLLG